MSERKKSQVGIFVIVAIVIVMSIAGFFALKSPKEDINPSVAPIYSFAENCVKEASENSVERIASTGGYFEKAENSAENEVAYYLYNGQNLMPSKEKIESELGKYIDNKLPVCFNDFRDFRDFNVKQGFIKTKAKINKGKVIFNIDAPIAITKSDKSYYFKSFKTEVNARLDIIYESLLEIMRWQMLREKGICISCLGKIADENDLYILMQDYKKDSVMFTIKDKNSKINNKDLAFNFMNRHS